MLQGAALAEHSAVLVALLLPIQAERCIGSFAPVLWVQDLEADSCGDAGFFFQGQIRDPFICCRKNI